MTAPKYARFPVPPVCTSAWTAEDWSKWVAEHGEPGILSIRARRWTDSHGNTYHSRRVTLNGKPVEAANSNFCYVYGTHYETEVRHALIAHDILSVTGDDQHTPLWQLCQREGLKLESEYSDVTRRRDLHGEGEE